jgi:hypothetical protein
MALLFTRTKVVLLRNDHIHIRVIDSKTTSIHEQLYSI